MTSRDYSSDAKEVNILIVVDCLKIGVKLGVFTIAAYGKTVRCSFNSFGQCIRKHQINLPSSSNFLPKMVPLTGTVPLTYFMGYSESILCITRLKYGQIP